LRFLHQTFSTVALYSAFVRRTCAQGEEMYWAFGDLHSTMGRHWKTSELTLLIIYIMLIGSCIWYSPHKVPYQLKYGENPCFLSYRKKPKTKKMK